MILALVLSNGDRKWGNIGSGPKRNPSRKLNTLPKLSMILPRSLTFVGFFFQPTHRISLFLPGNIVPH